jgi:BarA-like signal transduction histidine kinase
MGNNSLALGNYREAEKRYRHAFYMVPNRLYPLYLLAKLYHTEGDTVQFLKMADLVESFIPKVESVNTERLRNEIAGIKDCYLKDISIE